MPAYAYACSRHKNHVFEEVFKAGDAPDTVDCAQCKHRARRVFTTPMMPLMGGQTRTRRPNPADDLPVIAR